MNPNETTEHQDSEPIDTETPLSWGECAILATVALALGIPVCAIAYLLLK